MACKKNLILFFLIIISFSALADKLEKGFERLRIYDYFLAKQYFQQSLKDKTAGASYGLSIIFSTNNNPFYNLDSARIFILLSDSSLKKVTEKQKPYYNKLGVTDSSIQSLKDSICVKAFNTISSDTSLEKLNKYIADFFFCGEIAKATELRNTAAYNMAREENTEEAYRNFITTYPEAKEIKEAQRHFDERTYAESTADKTINSFIKFLQQNPRSPFRSQAEKMIYTLSTPDKTIDEYHAFIKKYPSNRNVNDAWREIYKLSMQNYNPQSLDNFKNRFPDYPFKNELREDYRLQSSFLLPFSRNELWGYIDEDGKEILKPQFKEISLFSEGLAAVSKNGKYGYISKSGKEVIPFIYEEAESFKNNTAVVNKDGKFGLINRNNEFLIPAEYDDLSEPSEDICVAILNDKSGYISTSGKKITDLIFDIANDFKDGSAIVATDDEYGLLNNEGNFNIEQKYDELIFIGDGLLKAKQNSRWGVFNTSGEIILPFAFDAIGEMHENRCLVARNKKYGFIDATGKIIVPLNYSYSENLVTTAKFRNGYAVLSLKGKSILVDSMGTKISMTGFDDFGFFSEGLIPVRKNKKWGFADINGKIKIACKYEYANAFENDFAKVRLKTGTGIIDNTGKLIIPATYDDVDFSNGYFIIKSKAGKLGLMNKQGQLLLQPDEGYDRIDFLSEIIVAAFIGESRTYFNLSSGKIIFKEE